MRTYPECLPCFIHQSRDAASLFGMDEDAMSEMHREVDSFLEDCPRNISPPEIAKSVYKIIAKYTEGADFYQFFIFKAKYSVVAKHIGCDVR